MCGEKLAHPSALQKPPARRPTRHGVGQPPRDVLRRHALPLVGVGPQAARRRHLGPEGALVEVGEVARRAGVARLARLVVLVGLVIQSAPPSAVSPLLPTVCAKRTPLVPQTQTHLDPALDQGARQVVMVDEVPFFWEGRRVALLSSKAGAGAQRVILGWRGSINPASGYTDRTTDQPNQPDQPAPPHIACAGPITTGMGFFCRNASRTAGPLACFFLIFFIFSWTWGGGGVERGVCVCMCVCGMKVLCSETGPKHDSRSTRTARAPPPPLPHLLHADRELRRVQQQHLDGEHVGVRRQLDAAVQDRLVGDLAALRREGGIGLAGGRGGGNGVWGLGGGG
jgi:hypothetical protein